MPQSPDTLSALTVGAYAYKGGRMIQGAEMGHIGYRLVQQQEFMSISFNGVETSDPLTAMLEAARLFEEGQDSATRGSIPLSSMTEEEFVERFGA